MRKALIAAVIACITLHLAPSGMAVAQITPKRSPEELKKVESELSGALVQRDKLFVGHLLADEWALTEPDGTVRSKREVVEGITSGELKFDLVRIEEMEARIYGETGVVTGRLITEWERGGRENFAVCRFTDVLVWRENRWQFVARQLTRVPQPQH